MYSYRIGEHRYSYGMISYNTSLKTENSVSVCLTHCLLLVMSLAFSRVTEAWAVLRTGHTEGNDMAKYFLQACEELGLCAEASKCIPAGYNVGFWVNL